MRPPMDLRRTTERYSHAMGTARTNLDQSIALIISDDPEFSHALAARWQTERNLPAFTLMSGDLCQALDPDTFDLAVVGTLEPPLLASALKALKPAGKPRSEERRVGKECRSRWSPDHKKKKKK